MSQYLYSPANKNLYEETLSDFNNKSCLFSRTLMAQLETSQLKEGPFYQKHLKECDVCQAILNEYAAQERALSSKIPVVSAPDYLLEELRPELKQSLAYLQAREAQGKSSAVTGALILQSLKEFAFTLPRSRTFLSGLGLAFLSWLLLLVIKN